MKRNEVSDASIYIASMKYDSTLAFYFTINNECGELDISVALSVHVREHPGWLQIKAVGRKSSNDTAYFQGLPLSHL